MICSISGIRLPTSALTTLDVNGTQYKICTYLLRQWFSFAGPLAWDLTKLSESNLNDLKAFHFQYGLQDVPDKRLFFVQEFAVLLDILLYNEDLDNASPFLYAKVLLGSLLRYDATFAGILAHETFQHINLLLSDPLYDIPGDRALSLELLAELADLLYATFVTLVQDDVEGSISLINSFGKVQSLQSLQSLIFLPIA